MTSTPASIGFGTQQRPHRDDAVRSSAVSHHNDGSRDVTLNLAVVASNLDGTAAPAGLFTVSPASVVVPAGGDAAATVTVDTRVAGPDGYLAAGRPASPVARWYTRRWR
ncbi:hypothetical protein GCM10023322_32590 [Rugosimonospora acidiphila]|uniref:Uncharacterized protein n=1 Tax=Rugosimonospora acidiphila TaxID=556531 RepID=A0ABP9RT79_9ACTN